MTVYLDVVLLENLCMNYIILFATGYILKIKRKHIKLIVSGLIGGIYSILVYMEIMEIYSNIVAKIILSVVMVYIAYTPKTIKELFKVLIFFYLISFVFGGCAFALLYFIKPEEIFIRNGVFVGTYPIKIAILGCIVGFIVITIAFYIVKIKLGKKDIYCDITIFFNEKNIDVKALIDTGNMLKDPITNIPVIVVEKEKLFNLLPTSILNNLNQIIDGSVPNEIYEEKNFEYISKFRVIPFKSLGKENGLLLGFKTDKVIIKKDDTVNQINKVIVGIYNNKLKKKEQYSALVGLDIIEGGYENEFLANINGKH